MKRFLSLLLLVALVAPSIAEETHTTPLLLRHDVTSTSYNYVSYLGQNGDPFGGAKSSPTTARVKTSGSSATVVEETSGANPFTSIAVGDLLLLTIPATGAAAQRVVTARASAASITVDSVIDLSAGSTFRYYSASRGTGAESGWIRVAGDAKKTWSWTIATLAADSIEVVIECRDEYVSAPAIPIYPPVTSETDTCFVGSFNAAVKTCKFVAEEPYAQCRFGIKVTTDAGAQSVTAGYEGAK